MPRKFRVSGKGKAAIRKNSEALCIERRQHGILASEQAWRRAKEAGVPVHSRVADVLQPPKAWAGLFYLFFDRGCYHAVRRQDVQAYLGTLRRLTRPGALGLVLAGNAREPHEPGPPVVGEVEIQAEPG